MTIIEKINEIEGLTAQTEILKGENARLRALKERLEKQELTVSVIGQFKRGKSTLINALLGEELLPAGIVPITSAATELRYGEPSCSVKFNNGRVAPVPFGQLGNYINEQLNPGNVLGVERVELSAESDFLKNGLILVDTPGIGSYHKNNTESAYAYIKESDAVIFMLSVDSPINEIEIELLRNTEEYAAKFFFAVNKVDTISDEDCAAYIDYCRRLIAALMKKEEEDIVIFPISAMKNIGLEELKTAVSEDLRASSREILLKSAELKFRDILSCALSQIELYWKVLLMPPAVLRDTIKRLDEAMAGMNEKARAIVHEMEADRDIIIPGLKNSLELKLNDYKMELSSIVTEIFAMDYHYEIPRLEEKSASKDEYILASKLGAEFLETTGMLTTGLSEEMNRVLMFRNDNTVEVVNRIYELNKLTRTLKRYLNS